MRVYGHNLAHTQNDRHRQFLTHQAYPISLATSDERIASNMRNLKWPGIGWYPMLLVAMACAPTFAMVADHPNIVWLTSEDHGPEMGCYGDSLAWTSYIDSLAAKGMIFKRAWSVAPVCAPARTSIISGLYPSSSGGLHMRSMVSLPATSLA